MVKRAKLANVGLDNDEADPASEVETSFTPEDGETTQESNTVDSQPDPEDAPDAGDTDQDIADQEAAGVTNGGNKAPAEMSDKAKLTRLTKKVVALGEDFGAGKVSMIALAQTITEGAAENIVSVGHIGELYDKFRAASTKRASVDDGVVIPDEAIMDRLPEESTDKSRPQQISKLTRFVELGNRFTADAADLIRRAVGVHVGMLNGADRKAVKAGSTYTHLVEVARRQMDKQKDAEKAAKAANTVYKGTVDPLTNEEIRDFLSVQVKDDPEKDAADKIIEAIKTVRQAQNGSKDGTRPPVFSSHLDAAIEELRAALGDAEGGPENGEAKLAAYDKALSDAEEAHNAAEQKRLDNAAAKAAKALEPKPAKASKADRQAGLKNKQAA